MADATAEAQQEAPQAPKPSKPAKADKKAKSEKKGKPDKKGKQDVAAPDGPTVAAHPRAARSIARAKGWGGLAGFLVGGYLSLPTSTLAGAGLRALVAGAICYVACWGAAVFVWRRLVVIEIKAREQELVSDLLARRRALAGGGSGAPAGGRSGGRDVP